MAFFDMIDRLPELPTYGIIGALLVGYALTERFARSRWSR